MKNIFKPKYVTTHRSGWDVARSFECHYGSDILLLTTQCAIFPASGTYVVFDECSCVCVATCVVLFSLSFALATVARLKHQLLPGRNENISQTLFGLSPLQTAPT